VTEICKTAILWQCRSSTCIEGATVNLLIMAEKEEISLENQEKRGFGTRPQIRENPKILKSRDSPLTTVLFEVLKPN